MLDAVRGVCVKVAIGCPDRFCPVLPEQLKRHKVRMIYKYFDIIGLKLNQSK